MAASPVQVPTSILVDINTSTKPPQVNPDPTVLSIRSGQDVEWHCRDLTKSLVVRFPKKGEKQGQDYNGSPFNASEFRVPAGESAHSGPPLATAVCRLCSKPPDTSTTTHLHHKYDIYEVDPAGKETLVLDPIIIIIKP